MQAAAWTPGAQGTCIRPTRPAFLLRAGSGSPAAHDDHGEDRAARVIRLSDRQWEWAALRFENGQFDRPASVDTEAREEWFYQAIGASPAIFRRDPQAGSLYWLGHRDVTGAYLDGGRTYKLTVPLPVPGKLFWSVTVYDVRTRSQIQTAQARALLSFLFDFPDSAYVRIYGPEQAAFDKTWKPGDFEPRPSGVRSADGALSVRVRPPLRT
jgi:hypothetical protein